MFTRDYRNTDTTARGRSRAVGGRHCPAYLQRAADRQVPHFASGALEHNYGGRLATTRKAAGRPHLVSAKGSVWPSPSEEDTRRPTTDFGRPKVCPGARTGGFGKKGGPCLRGLAWRRRHSMEQKCSHARECARLVCRLSGDGRLSHAARTPSLAQECR